MMYKKKIMYSVLIAGLICFFSLMVLELYGKDQPLAVHQQTLDHQVESGMVVNSLKIKQGTVQLRGDLNSDNAPTELIGSTKEALIERRTKHKEDSEMELSQKAIFENFIRPVVERRTDAATNIQERFINEVRDEVWANHRESEINDLLYSNEYLATLSPTSVECKSTICSAILGNLGGDQSQIIEILRSTSNTFLTKRENYQNINSMNFHIAGDEESLTLLIYDEDLPK